MLLAGRGFFFFFFWWEGSSVVPPCYHGPLDLGIRMGAERAWHMTVGFYVEGVHVLLWRVAEVVGPSEPSL